MPGAELTDDQGAGAEDQATNQPGAEGTGEGENQGGESSLTLEQAQAEIKKLRKENAARRTTGKTLEERLLAAEGFQGKVMQALGLKEDEKEQPEAALERLNSQNSAMAMELELTSLAYQLEVPPQGAKYFKFLMSERLGELGEEEELDGEAIQEIAAQVRTQFGKPAASASSVSGKAPESKGSDGEVTLDQFLAMNIYQKQEMASSKPALYDRLFQQAVKSNKFR